MKNFIEIIPLDENFRIKKETRPDLNFTVYYFLQYRKRFLFWKMWDYFFKVAGWGDDGWSPGCSESYDETMNDYKKAKALHG